MGKRRITSEYRRSYLHSPVPQNEDQYKAFSEYRQVRRRLESAHHQLEWVNGESDTASVTSAPTSSRKQPAPPSASESAQIKEPDHLRKHRYLTRRVEQLLSERQATAKPAGTLATNAVAETQTSARCDSEQPNTGRSEPLATPSAVPKLENLDEPPQTDENEPKEDSPVSVPESAADAKGKTFVVAPQARPTATGAARRAQQKKPATRAPRRPSASSGGSGTPRVPQLRARSRPAQTKAKANANANGMNNVSCLFSAEASAGTQTQPTASYCAPHSKFVMYGHADEERSTFTLKRTYNVKSATDVFESALRAKQLRETQRQSARERRLQQVASAKSRDQHEFELQLKRETARWQTEYRQHYARIPNEEYARNRRVMAARPFTAPSAEVDPIFIEPGANVTPRSNT